MTSLQLTSVQTSALLAKEVSTECNLFILNLVRRRCVLSYFISSSPCVCFPLLSSQFRSVQDCSLYQRLQTTTAGWRSIDLSGAMVFSGHLFWNCKFISAQRDRTEMSMRLVAFTWLQYSRYDTWGASKPALEPGIPQKTAGNRPARFPAGSRHSSRLGSRHSSRLVFVGNSWCL